MREFDPDALAIRLEAVSDLNCAMFAWSCTCRIEPYFRSYAERTGDVPPDLIANVLDDVAHGWTAGGPDEDGLRGHFEVLERLIPDEEPHMYERGQMIFEDAIICAYYTIQSALESNREPAIWVGIRTYDISDRYVVNSRNLDTNSQAEMEILIGDSVVQRELERQDRDLKCLERSLSNSEKEDFIASRRRETMVDGSEIPM